MQPISCMLSTLVVGIVDGNKCILIMSLFRGDFSGLSVINASKELSLLKHQLSLDCC